MTKVICTTTINAPTEAIELFDAMPDWALIVAGDRKTPSDYKLNRGLYLTPAMQEQFNPKLSAAIGWNCIQRRNMAFLWAIKEMKADIVATVDDDNMPYDWWGRNIYVGQETLAMRYSSSTRVFDPLRPVDRDRWHRGYPLQLLPGRREFPYTIGPENITADIQADLWDGAPDIDAVCRMMFPEDVKYSSEDPTGQSFRYFSNHPSPFNSQNTFLSATVMPHYFMFPGIGRMDDIWAAYHVEAQGFKVIYGAPTVIQKRNPHEVTDDMRAEYLGYEHNHEIVRRIGMDKNAVLKMLPDRSFEAFKIYQEAMA